MWRSIVRRKEDGVKGDHLCHEYPEGTGIGGGEELRNPSGVEKAFVKSGTTAMKRAEI